MAVILAAFSGLMQSVAFCYSYLDFDETEASVGSRCPRVGVGGYRPLHRDVYLLTASTALCFFFFAADFLGYLVCSRGRDGEGASHLCAGEVQRVCLGDKTLAAL